MKKIFLLAVMVLSSSAFARGGDGPGNSKLSAIEDFDLNETCIQINNEDPLMDTSASFVLQCRSTEFKNEYIATISGGGSVYSRSSPETMVLVQIKNGKCAASTFSATEISNRSSGTTIYSGKMSFKNGEEWTYELTENGQKSKIVQKDHNGKIVGGGPFYCK